MPLLRIRPPIHATRLLRQFSTSLPRAQSPASIPYTQTCPSPTCACAATPPDLDIDRKSPLLNTMAPYAEQVLICTGKEDWPSNIEHEESTSGDFIRGLKGEIGKGAKGFDPFNNVLITASSLPASETKDTTSILLFPTFKRISALPHTPSTFSNFATAYLKARTLHPYHASLSPEQKAHLTRDESLASTLPPPEPISTPTILICGHGGRDKRCGILGPILQSEFKKELTRRGIKGDVGVISHIGGHKYAGNVIIYLPPRTDGTGEGLSGVRIWYGRVNPENVEGIVEETVVKGKVITELLRGGITQDGGNLGRMLEAQIAREKGELGEDEGGKLKLKPRSR